MPNNDSVDSVSSEVFSMLWFFSLTSPMSKLQGGRLPVLPCCFPCSCTCSQEEGSHWKLASLRRLPSIQNLLGFAKVCMCVHRLSSCMEEDSPNKLVPRFKDFLPCFMVVSFFIHATSPLSAVWDERMDSEVKGKMLSLSLYFPHTLSTESWYSNASSLLGSMKGASMHETSPIKSESGGIPQDNYVSWLIPM